jgi:hypothetical protein
MTDTISLQDYLDAADAVNNPLSNLQLIAGDLTNTGISGNYGGELR